MDDVQPIPIPEEPLPNRHVDEIRFSGEEILASDFSDVGGVLLRTARCWERLRFQMIRSLLPQYKRKQQKRNKRKNSPFRQNGC